MNVNEVPQDARDIKPGDNLRKLVYAVGEDGGYTSVNSKGWEVENLALQQAWDDIDDTLADTARQVAAGTLSPIAYYMRKSLMDVSILARYMGKWQWQVKRHFNPPVFRSLSQAVLEKYAQVFNITVSELINFGREGHA